MSFKKGKWLQEIINKRVVFKSGKREGQIGLFRGFNGSNCRFVINGEDTCISLNVLVLVLE